MSLCADDQIGGRPPLCTAPEIPDEIVLSLFISAPDLAMSVPDKSRPLNLETTVDIQWIFDDIDDGS
jgi:hypothetical protein